MSDPANEPVDVLDDAGMPTGQVKSRSQVHRDGDWHRAFHLWIVKEGRFVLFARRSRHKDLEPGRIDVTVGGHYRAGETLLDVVREAEEELGVRVRPGDLSFLGAHRSERVYAHAVDREHQEVYALRLDRDLRDYRLDPLEVDVLYEVPLGGALALYEDGGFVAAAGRDSQDRPNNALLVRDDVIEAARAETATALRWIEAWLAEADPEARTSD